MYVPLTALYRKVNLLQSSRILKILPLSSQSCRLSFLWEGFSSPEASGVPSDRCRWEGGGTLVSAFGLCASGNVANFGEVSLTSRLRLVICSLESWFNVSKDCGKPSVKFSFSVRGVVSVAEERESVVQKLLVIVSLKCA